MINLIKQLDRELFYLINESLGNPIFDLLMPWFRNTWFWFPLYAICIGFIIYRYKIKSIYVLLMVALTVIASDQMSANLIKKKVQRIRPCNSVLMDGYVVERVSCGSGYSFPSAHASNHFALAVLIIFLFADGHKWVRLAAILWACSVGFAQIYVGVHFPIDILGGALLGSAIAVFFVYIFRSFIRGK